MSTDSEEVEYRYPSVDIVLDLYAALCGYDRNHVLDYVRDENGLASAVARPRQYAYYQGADIALQAAVLTHGIAEGQVFFEGNKTIALNIMLAFLDQNGYHLNGLTDDDLYEWMRALAGASKIFPPMDENGLAEVIRRYMEPRDS